MISSAVVNEMLGIADVAAAPMEVPSTAGDSVEEWVSSAAGFGGRRLEFRRIFSVETVSRPCLKTYLEMAEAKMAGLAVVFFMSLLAAAPLLPVSFFSVLSPDLIFLHGCSIYPLGRTEPFLTK